MTSRSLMKDAPGGALLNFVSRQSLPIRPAIATVLHSGIERPARRVKRIRSWTAPAGSMPPSDPASLEIPPRTPRGCQGACALVVNPLSVMIPLMSELIETCRTVPHLKPVRTGRLDILAAKLMG